MLTLITLSIISRAHKQNSKRKTFFEEEIAIYCVWTDSPYYCYEAAASQETILVKEEVTVLKSTVGLRKGLSYLRHMAIGKESIFFKLCDFGFCV